MNINAYNFNSQIIDLEKVPALSESTVMFLRKIESVGNVNTKGLTYVPVDLVARRLQQLADDLEMVKNHPVKNVVFAVCRSLFAASAIAAGILGVLFTSFPVLLGIGASVVYLSSSIVNSDRDGIHIDINIWDFALLILGGAVFPLYGLIDKEAKLTCRSNNFKNEIDISLQQRSMLFKIDFSKILENLNSELEVPGSYDLTVKFIQEIQSNAAFFSKL